MGTNTVWFVATLALAAIAGQWLDTPPVTKKDLLRGLEARAVVRADATVALGYNACEDVVVPALELLDTLPAAPGSGPQVVDTVPTPANHAAIASVQQLRDTFAHFFAAGAAAERVVTTRDLFQHVLHAARRVANIQSNVGGNAALMAAQMARLVRASRSEAATSGNGRGNVLLGGVIGPTVGRMLEGVSVAGSPSFDGDEVHLIMEYPAGATWQGFTAPRANRFIITHDRANGMLKALEPFHAVLLKESAPDVDLLVLAGMHMVERAQPGEDNYRRRRLGDVASAVGGFRGRHPAALVHAELASVGTDDHMAAIVEVVASGVDSMGLNEQELLHVFNTARSGALFEGMPPPDLHEDDLAGAEPHPHAVATFISYLFKVMPRLARVHFHALQFHVVALRDGAPGWGAATSSAAAGSVAATLRACGVESSAELHGNDLDLLTSLTVDTTPPAGVPSSVSLSADHAVASWSWDGVEFAVAPVLVCKAPKQTVGLGDAVSATGLLAHVQPQPAVAAAAM